MLPLQDKRLNALFRPMETRLNEGKPLDDGDISALIDATKSAPQSKDGAQDLATVLDRFGSELKPSARATLEAFVQSAQADVPSNTFSRLQLQIHAADGNSAKGVGADRAPKTAPGLERLVALHVPQVFTALTKAEIAPLLAELGNGWAIAGDSLKKTFAVKDFNDSLAKATQIGSIADAEAHHPDLRVTYGELGVELSTHDAGGLTLMDFSVAAKIEHALNDA